MVRDTATLPRHQPHGPVASSIKWAFKGYLRAQRALDDVDRAMSRLALLSAVALPVGVISDLYGLQLLGPHQVQLMVLAMAVGALVILTLGMLQLAKYMGRCLTATIA